MLKRSSFVRLLVLLIFLALPISLLAGRFLQPEGVARGKSSAFPLSDQLTPEQAQAQELALADARVQGYTAGHQSEVFGVRRLLAGLHTPASEACLTADCRQVEIYNFDENATVKAIVNLDTQEVLDVLFLVGEQPGINKRLADRAMEIAVNAPAVIDALGYRPTKAGASMVPVPGNMLDTSCAGGHLCAAPNFHLADGRILWAVVDLTEDRLAGTAWTEVPPDPAASSIPFIPEGCPAPGTVTRDGWDLAYGVTGSDGLHVYDVTYNGVEVLNSVKVVEWHVDYGSWGYLDVPGCGGGGGGFPIYPYGSTVINDLYDAQNELIGFEVMQDFRMGNWGAQCNYRYEQRIQFFNDGRFRVTGGAFGKGCDTTSFYRPVVRIDIAVNGDDDDNFGYYDGNGWVDLTTEDFRLPYPDPQFPNNGPHELTPENYSWRVHDAGGLGYYIEQDLGQFSDMLPGRGDEPFLYATLHKPAEGDSDMGVIGSCCNDDHLQGPHAYINGESITDENIVIWYVSQMETVVAPPDYYCWTVSGEPNPETYPCFGGPMFHPFGEWGQAAEASFTHDGPKVVGEAVNFTNATTGTPPITYSWDFGDGSDPVTEENPSHVYDQAGDFLVTLTATNTLGSSVYTDTVTIEAGAAAQASFTYSGTLLIGEVISFTNTTTGTAPITYTWNFGDGSDPVMEENPAHVYEQAGDFIVTLTAENDWGSSVYSETVTINMAATAGTILTDLDGIPAVAGQEVHFSSTAAGTQPLTYAWDFGDGTTSDEAQPVHAFAAPGVYSVTLTVSNDYGSDTAVLSLVVTKVQLPLTHYWPALTYQE